MQGSARAALLAVVCCLGCSAAGEHRHPDAAKPKAPAITVSSTERGCRAPLGLDVVPLGDGRSGSTVVMARVHGRLLAYVADEDATAVRIVDADGPAEIGSVAMPGRPARMVMLPGGRLAVTLRDKAEVALYTPSPVGETGLDPLCSLATADEPVDLAATPDGATLLALSDWGHALTAFDLDSGEARSELALPRSPRAVLVTADGARAFVAHAAGGAMTSVDLREAVPTATRVDLSGRSRDRRVFVEELFAPDEFAVVDSRPFPGAPPMPRHRVRPPRIPPPLPVRQRSACQGFALAELSGPSAKVFAPMVEVATGDLEVQSSGYGPGGPDSSATPELSVIGVVDEAIGKAEPASLSASEPERAEPPPCLLPRAAAVHGRSLYVACMGIDSLVEYDVSKQGSRPVERRRWKVAAGPTGVTIHGDRVVVWSQFEGAMTFVSLSGSPAPATLQLQRSRRTEDEATIALGRTLFHTSSDARISSDGRACASCHPNGRDDGLVWSTPGGPRQTPMLAGRLPDTAPYGWDGAGSDVEHHLGHTFARLEGKGLPPHELAALVRYVTTLDGPPRSSQPRATGEQPPGAEARLDRGRDVFFSAGCGSCHAAESDFTDGKNHDVKSARSADAITAFDTPSLRFVGGTAPYFHDGRFATLRDLLATKEGPMGAARGRNADDLDALEAYVRSL